MARATRAPRRAFLRGATQSRIFPRALVVVSLVLVFPPASAEAKRAARHDPTEPLRTTPAFLDQSVELGVEWSRQADGDQIEIAPGLEWIFWDRLELSAEIPTGISVPARGSTVGDLGDVGLGAQVLLCCSNAHPIAYLSLRGEVDAPTGDRSKGIGGDGSWGVAVLPGLYFSIADQLPDVLLQMELGYEQQIRLDADGLELARERGVDKTRRKDVIWNIAFAHSWWDGLIQPVFEILGTSTVDAIDRDDEGTVVELSAGFWFAPHPREHWLSALSYAIGGSFPVTSDYEDQSVVVFIIEWALD